MKNILLLIHDDSGQEARFQAALDVTRAIDGHLTCLDVTYVPPIFSDAYADGAYAMADLMTQETARESANKQRLVARLAVEDVSWDWIDVSGDYAPALKHAAELADLIVVNRTLDDVTYPDMRDIASELIVRSGKPILAVPPNCRRLDLDGAFVAWDGSVCAATAMRAAVPLLQRTRRVVLLEIQDGSTAAPAEDAAAYLSRHGVHALVERTSCARGEAGEVLLRAAHRPGFGYMVMGGFGHARLIEAVFGGVTRRMLDKSPLPLLMAH